MHGKTNNELTEFEYKDQESQLPAQILRQDKGKVSTHIKSDHCFGFGKTMI